MKRGFIFANCFTISLHYIEAIVAALHSVGIYGKIAENAIISTLMKIGSLSSRGDFFVTPMEHLAEFLGLSYSSTLRRLKMLQDCGIIEKRSTGRAIKFRILICPGVGSEKVIYHEPLLPLKAKSKIEEGVPLSRNVN